MRLLEEHESATWHGNFAGPCSLKFQKLWKVNMSTRGMLVELLCHVDDFASHRELPTEEGKKTKKGITLWGVNPSLYRYCIKIMRFNWGLFVLIQVNFVGVNPSLYAEFLYS